MLGCPQPLAWRQDADSLTIDIPAELQTESDRPCKQAYSIKIPAQLLFHRALFFPNGP
jgi:hypothetical protein